MTLPTIGSYDSCDQLKLEIDKRASSIIKKYNRRDEKYDRKTKNGRTEGVYIENFILQGYQTNEYLLHDFVL